MSKPVKVYEVYTQDGDQSLYFFNRRSARGFAFGEEGMGDWDMAAHADACELLEKKDQKIRELEIALARIADMLAERLPIAKFGGPDLDKFTKEDREAADLIARHVPTVADRYGLEVKGRAAE